MDLGIAGRRALVCGGSRGMGYAIALQLAREGAQVTIAARRHGPLAEAAAAIAEATGHGPVVVAADVTTAAGRMAVLAACPDPDILVTNSDGPSPTPLSELTTADWLVGLEALMLAPLALIQAVLEPMIARRFGRVVNIVSRSVKIAQAEMPLSNGARSGLVGVVAGLSRQVARHNVTINNLLPGIFDTDAQRNHVAGIVARTGEDGDALWASRQQANPAQRYGRAEEAGAYAAFLCSDQAGFITGQNLLIDGGQYPGPF
jgi:3-oxoacyl-[acyl-carrier protein] reductase